MSVVVYAAAPYIAGALGASGIAVGASHRRELVRRWQTWVVTAPLVGGAFLLGAPGAAALAGLLGVVAAYEYARLSGLRAIDRSVLQAVALALPALAWLAPHEFWRLLLIVPMAAALPTIASADSTQGGRRICRTCFGGLWLAALSGLVLLGH